MKKDELSPAQIEYLKTFNGDEWKSCCDINGRMGKIRKTVKALVRKGYVEEDFYNRQYRKIKNYREEK
ncbi:MAG: hypothetical protein ACYCSQ_00425 [bacterium]